MLISIILTDLIDLSRLLDLSDLKHSWMSNQNLVLTISLGKFPAYPEDYLKSHVNSFIINWYINVLRYTVLISLNNFPGVMQPDHADEPTQTYVCCQSSYFLMIHLPKVMTADGSSICSFSPTLYFTVDLVLQCDLLSHTATTLTLLKFIG